MNKETLQIDNTGTKEKVSFDKLVSLYGIVFGARANQFDAFVDQAPHSHELSDLARKLGKPKIENVIFDLDGTLVPPYADVNGHALQILETYPYTCKKVAIYTNSPHSDRLNVLRDRGIAVAETGVGKPSLRGFQKLCDQQQMDPAATAMIGNSPITDMPLADGEKPFFPLNVLVKSIPPDKQQIKSWMKFFRASLFHAICVSAAGIVKMRNSKLIHE